MSEAVPSVVTKYNLEATKLVIKHFCLYMRKNNKIFFLSLETVLSFCLFLLRNQIDFAAGNEIVFIVSERDFCY